MAPSIAVDDLSDFTPNLPAKSTTPRTLLLSPPSLSSHPDKLNDVVAAHDRSATDIQMLDRLSLSLVSLPDATYDIILLLTDADGTRTESKKILTQPLLSRVVQALKPGGRLTSQDGRFATDDQQERADSIFAGLIWEDSKLVRPSYEAAASVPLRLGRKKENGTESATTSAAGTGAVTLNLNGKRKNGPTEIGAPAGVGFVDFSDDLDFLDGNGSDEELIDEDSLLTEEDLNRAVVQPPECRPKNGKRRRACKDCTCGLAQKLEAEDAATRSQADQNLAKLKSDDLAEVDFTVQGKVGSCGNCALGDAFRCDGCPYIGLPAFKPGEEVRILNEEVQL